jgi:hypothetical protein
MFRGFSNASIRPESSSLFINAEANAVIRTMTSNMLHCDWESIMMVVIIEDGIRDKKYRGKEQSHHGPPIILRNLSHN